MAPLEMCLLTIEQKQPAIYQKMFFLKQFLRDILYLLIRLRLKIEKQNPFFIQVV